MGLVQYFGEAAHLGGWVHVPAWLGDAVLDHHPHDGPAGIAFCDGHTLGAMLDRNGLRPGLGMLVKDLAEELAPRGVRINALLPGRIATDRLAARGQRRPGLAVILVGDNPASQVYVRNKRLACEECGARHRARALRRRLPQPRRRRRAPRRCARAGPGPRRRAARRDHPRGHARHRGWISRAPKK